MSNERYGTVGDKAALVSQGLSTVKQHGGDDGNQTEELTGISTRTCLCFA